MDERPLDPVAKSDEELARQLQEENDREEQDAAYALQYPLLIFFLFSERIRNLLFFFSGFNGSKKKSSSA